MPSLQTTFKMKRLVLLFTVITTISLALLNSCKKTVTCADITVSIDSPTDSIFTGDHLNIKGSCSFEHAKVYWKTPNGTVINGANLDLLNISTQNAGTYTFYAEYVDCIVSKAYSLKVYTKNNNNNNTQGCTNANVFSNSLGSGNVTFYGKFTDGYGHDYIRIDIPNFGGRTSQILRLYSYNTIKYLNGTYSLISSNSILTSYNPMSLTYSFNYNYGSYVFKPQYPYGNVVAWQSGSNLHLKLCNVGIGDGYSSETFDTYLVIWVGYL